MSTIAMRKAQVYIDNLKPGDRRVLDNIARTYTPQRIAQLRESATREEGRLFLDVAMLLSQEYRK